MPRQNEMNRWATALAGRHLPLRAAAFTLLSALLAGACGTPTPSPSASATPVPSISASSSASSGAAASPEACAASGISAIGGTWEGAAGSRGSDVVVGNRGGAACLLPAGPTVALVDGAGTVLLANTPLRVGTGPSIEAGGTIGFSLLIGNWCNQPVTLPLHFRLALAGDAVEIGSLALTTRDELPPCNGPGQPATISTTDWAPR